MNGLGCCVFVKVCGEVAPSPNLPKRYAAAFYALISKRSFVNGKLKAEKAAAYLLRDLVIRADPILKIQGSIAW